MKFNYLLLILSISLFSCPSSDEGNGTNADDFDLLTGIELRDQNGEGIGKAGNPNNRKDDIIFYPNPAGNVGAVFSISTDIAQVWLIPALQNTDFQNTDFTNVLANTDYAIATLSAAAVLEVMPAGNNFSLNLEGLAAGYYRIFYLKTDEQLAWDNIYIAPQTNDLNAVYLGILDEW